MPSFRHGRSSSFGQTTPSACSPSVISTISHSNTSSHHTHNDVASGGIQERLFSCPFCKLHPWEWFFETNRKDRCSFYFARGPEGLKTMIRHHVIIAHKKINQRLPESDVRYIQGHVFEDLDRWFSNKVRHKKRWLGDEAVRSWSYVFNAISNGGLSVPLGEHDDQDVILHHNPYFTKEWVVEVFEQHSRQTDYFDPDSVVQSDVLQRTIRIIIENANIARDYLKRIFGHLKQDCTHSLELIDLHRRRHIQRLKREWPMMWNAARLRTSRAGHQTSQDVQGTGEVFQEKSPFYSTQDCQPTESPTFGHSDDMQLDFELNPRQDPHHNLNSQHQSINTWGIPRVQIDNFETAFPTTNNASSGLFQAQQQSPFQQQSQQASEPMKRSSSFSGFQEPDPFDVGNVHYSPRKSFDQPPTSNLLFAEWPRYNVTSNQQYLGRQSSLLFPPCAVCQTSHDPTSRCGPF